MGTALIRNNRTRFTVSAWFLVFLVFYDLPAVSAISEAEAQNLGPELVVNGDFSQGSTGWTIWNRDGTIATMFNSTKVPNGGTAPCLEIKSVTSPFFYNGGVYQALSLSSGQPYAITALTRDLNINDDLQWVEIHVGSQLPQDGQDYPITGPITATRLQWWDTYFCDNWNGTPGCIQNETTFVATAPTMYLVLKCGGTTNSMNASFDNISVRQTDQFPATKTPTRTRTPTLTPTMTITRTATIQPSSTPTPAGPENVVNGDFSNGNAGWTPWTAGLSEYNIAFNSQDIPSGGTAPCLALDGFVSDSTPFWQYCYAGVYQELSLIPGKQYAIRSLSKSVRTTCYLGCIWNAYLLIGSSIPVDNVLYYEVSGTILLKQWGFYSGGGSDPWDGDYGSNPNRDSFIATSDTMYLMVMIEVINARLLASFDNISVQGPLPEPTITPTPSPTITLSPTISPSPTVSPLPMPVNSWVKATDAAPWQSRYGHSMANFQDKIWIYGGQDIYPILSDIWSSPDGLSWTKVTDRAPPGTRMDFAMFVFDSKMWIMGGRNDIVDLNDIWNTSDGVNWTRVLDAAPWTARNNLKALVHDGKMWIMGGAHGPTRLNDIWYSTDGIVWTQAASSASWIPRTFFASVSFKGKMWVLGGNIGSRSYANDIWSSTDGVQWKEEIHAAPWPVRESHCAVVYKDEIWILGGYNNYLLNDVWHSPDGINWFPSVKPVWSPRKNHSAVIFGNRIWVTAGFNYLGTNSLRDVYYSDESFWPTPIMTNSPTITPSHTNTPTRTITPTKTTTGTPTITPTPTLTLTPPPPPTYATAVPGRGWTQVTSHANWTARHCHSSVSFDGRMWILGGASDLPTLITSDVWFSWNGQDWFEATGTAPWGKRVGHAAIVFDSKIWIIGGLVNSAFKNDVWSSRDGANWTLVTATAPWRARWNMTAIVHNGRIWIMGGAQAYASLYNDVWSSADGENWEQATASAPWSGRTRHASVEFNGRMWIIGGDTGSRQLMNDVWSSTDGSQWTEEIRQAPWASREAHACVVQDNELWILGGSSSSYSLLNDVWHSSDGVNWQQTVFPTLWTAREDHSAISHDNRIWVMGGWDKTYSHFTNDVYYSEDFLAITPTPTPTPVPPRGYYMLDGWGTLWRSPWTLPGPHYGYATGDWPWFGWDVTRGFEVSPDRDGFYMLDGYGVIWPNGNTMNLSYAPGNLPWFGSDIASDIESSTTGRGLLVLDAHGLLYPYGDYKLPESVNKASRPYFHFDEKSTHPQAPVILTLDAAVLESLAHNTPVYDFVDPPPGVSRYNPANKKLLAAEAVAVHPNGRGLYILDSYGGIHAVGDVPAVIAPVQPYFGWNIARDLVLTPNAEGAYVLDGWGGIHTIGSAAPPPYTGVNKLPYFPNYDVARGLKVIY